MTFFNGPLHMDEPVLADQQEIIYRSAQTQDIVWKNCWWWWMIGMDGERVSGESVLSEWLNDDDDIYIYIYIYIKRSFLSAVLPISVDKLYTGYRYATMRRQSQVSKHSFQGKTVPILVTMVKCNKRLHSSALFSPTWTFLLNKNTYFWFADISSVILFSSSTTCQIKEHKTPHFKN